MTPDENVVFIFYLSPSIRPVLIGFTLPAFTPCAFDVFGEITDIHQHATLGAWLFFGVCLRDGTGLCGFFVCGLGFWPERRRSLFLFGFFCVSAP